MLLLALVVAGAVAQAGTPLTDGKVFAKEFPTANSLPPPSKAFFPAIAKSVGLIGDIKRAEPTKTVDASTADLQCYSKQSGLIEQFVTHPEVVAALKAKKIKRVRVLVGPGAAVQFGKTSYKRVGKKKALLIGIDASTCKTNEDLFKTFNAVAGTQIASPVVKSDVKPAVTNNLEINAGEPFCGNCTVIHSYATIAASGKSFDVYTHNANGGSDDEKACLVRQRHALAAYVAALPAGDPKKEVFAKASGVHVQLVNYKDSTEEQVRLAKLKLEFNYKFGKIAELESDSGVPFQNVDRAPNEQGIFMPLNELGALIEVRAAYVPQAANEADRCQVLMNERTDGSISNGEEILDLLKGVTDAASLYSGNGPNGEINPAPQGSNQRPASNGGFSLGDYGPSVTGARAGN